MTDLIQQIKARRAKVGLSQEQMAQLLDMSRLTYASIESGKRELKTSELKKLGDIFEISTEELLGATKDDSEEESITSQHPLYKMIQVILYILNKCAGKPNVGKIVLNKLLYFADFNHYEKYWKSITTDEYIKMPMGPVPKSIDGVIALMQKSGLIEIITPYFHGYKQLRFIPNREADVGVFTGTEMAELDYVIEKYSDKTGKQLTDLSHEDTPWKATKEIGDVVEYGLAHYRSPAYSVTEFVDEGD